MRKETKTGLIMLTILIMTFTSLSSCKPTVKPNSTVSKNLSSQTLTSGSGSEATASEGVISQIEKPEDMGGYEFTYVSMWAGLLNPEKGASTKGDNLLEIYKGIEKDYNCKINFIGADPTTLVSDMVNAIAAGDKYADVVEMNPATFYSLVVADMLEPIENTKIIKNNDTIWFNPNKEFSTFRGKQYGVSWTMSGYALELRNVLFFNKSIMAKYKQPDLYDLVRKGQWTWDKFMELTKDINTKSNGAVRGITAYNSISPVLPWITSNNANLIKYTNGKYTYTGKDAASIEALQFCQDMMMKNKTLKLPEAGALPETVFMNGETAFFLQHYYLAWTTLNPGMTDDYGVLPVPKGPQSTNYMGHFADAKFTSFISGNPDIEKASKILYAIAKRTATKDWKAVELETSLRDEESVEMIEIMMANPVIDISVMLPGTQAIVYGEIGKVMDGTSTPKASLQSMGGSMQSTLDDFFKQK